MNFSKFFSLYSDVNLGHLSREGWRGLAVGGSVGRRVLSVGLLRFFIRLRDGGEFIRIVYMIAPLMFRTCN